MNTALRNRLVNWAGNYTFTAARFHEPESVEHVVEVIKSSQNVSAVGTRHSFNSIADTPADLVSLAGLPRIINLDPDRRTVTVDAGVRYGELGVHLHAHGFALNNLASLPHISVAGACATATHGSGINNGNLATAVRAMQLVTGDGNVMTFSRESHGDHFDGMVVHLGALGIVTTIALEIVPAFSVRQKVYENLSTDELDQCFDQIMSAAYSVSLFTNWRPGRVNQVWLKRLDTDTRANPATFFGAAPASADRHPIDGISAINCTPQLDVPGPWHVRLPHFRMDYTPSSGDELQSEYFVPREHAAPAFNAIAELRDRITPLLLISEIRAVAGDELWMSPCYHQDSVAFHFTWKPDWPAVRAVLPLIERTLAPFSPRPHWGKLFTLSPSELRTRYPRMPNFLELMKSIDPTGKFRNSFRDAHLMG